MHFTLIRLIAIVEAMAILTTIIMDFITIPIGSAIMEGAVMPTILEETQETNVLNPASYVFRQSAAYAACAT
jgi:hypothetical protein